METLNNKTNKAIFETNAQACDIMNDIIKKDMKEIKIDIPKGYELFGKMEKCLISKLDKLPYMIYYEGKEYLLNLYIHNDGVNIDYCDGEDELFGLGMSYDENYCCKSEILNAIIDKAIAITNDELWEYL